MFFHKCSPFAFLARHKGLGLNYTFAKFPSTWCFLQPVWIPNKLQTRTVYTDIAFLLSRSWGFIFILTTTRLMKYCSDFQKINALLAWNHRLFQYLSNFFKRMLAFWSGLHILTPCSFLCLSIVKASSSLCTVWILKLLSFVLNC
jgi:hypothetical protein